MIRSTSLWGLVVSALLTLCGCNSDLRQPTYKTVGRITLDGRPLPNATIVFHAIDKSKFQWEELPQALSDESGNFEVFTYVQGDGAPAADYKVGVALFGKTLEIGDDQVVHDKNEKLLPVRYQSPETSGITVKIEPKTNELQSFELKSR